jgi:PBSX family phage terminase large subunit
VPFSEKQQEYLNNATHRWNFKTGATRSGKTFLDFSFVIPKRIIQAPEDGAIVILGNTRGTIARNVLDPMRQIWGAGLVSSISSDNTVKIFGRKCYALGADKISNVSKIQGMGISYAYGDEVTTWNPDVFSMLKSRLDKPGACFDGTCNPDNPFHWVKKFIDSDADIYSQSYTIDDNPFLSEEFVANLKREYSGTVYYARYILGEWAKAEGRVYPNYNNTVKTENRNYTKYIASMDYGIMNPTAILLWGFCNNKWYVVREYYHNGRESGEQKTDQQYLDAYKRLVEDFPVEMLIVDPSATSFITLARQNGIKVRKAENDVLTGIQRTALAMQNKSFYVNDCCKKTLEEFEVYSWDSGDDDKVIKENDHAMDALRYFVNTVGIYKESKAYKSVFVN